VPGGTQGADQRSAELDDEVAEAADEGDAGHGNVIPEGRHADGDGGWHAARIGAA
jgi:hypothetical protein